MKQISFTETTAFRALVAILAGIFVVMLSMAINSIRLVINFANKFVLTSCLFDRVVNAFAHVRVRVHRATLVWIICAG